MGRTVTYEILDDGINKITPGQWKRVEKLQHDYNSNYEWQVENLSFQMYSVYPHFENFKSGKFNHLNITGESTIERFWNTYAHLRQQGKTDKQIEKMGLTWILKGGYKGEEYLASGFTKTYEEDRDAEKVIEFIVKVSKILKDATIRLEDEGDLLGELVINIKNGVIEIDKFKTKQCEKYMIHLLSKGYDLMGSVTNSLINLKKSKKNFKKSILPKVLQVV